MNTPPSTLLHPAHRSLASTPSGGIAGTARSASERPPARMPRRVSRGIVASLLVLGILLAMGTAWQIVDLRGRALDNSKLRLSTLTLVLADQADRSFQAIEQMQIGLIEEMRAAGIATEQQYISRMRSHAVFESLHQRIANLPQVNAVTMIDENGNLLNFSRYWPIPKVNIADRDYFKALKANPKLDKFISLPVQNRGDGVWTVYLAKPFRAPDGTFLGMVLGAVQLSYFERLYRDIAPGPDAVIAMFRDDGVRLLRMPPADYPIGRSDAGNAVKAMLNGGRASQVIRDLCPIDGKDDLISTRHVRHFPVIVLLSQTVASILSGWREQAILLGGLAALLEGGLLWIGLLVTRLVRSQRRLLETEADRNQADRARTAAEADAILALAREQGERELRTQYSRFASAMTNMKQGLIMFDVHGRVVVANEQLARIFGGGEIAPGLTLAVLLRRARQPGGLTFRETCALWRQLGVLLRVGEAAHITVGTDDDRSFSVAFQPTSDGGCLLTCEDVTEQKAVEARIAHLAHHDLLTDLPNRLLFQEILDRAVAAARHGARYALLYLDLDRFKEVNDTLGHAAGDRLLRLAAMRIQGCVRDNDVLARLSGDEFAIVQVGLQSPSSAAELARRLIEAVDLPFELDGHQISVGLSIGIALIPDDSLDGAELLKQADLALYQAKADGRGCFRFFDLEMDRVAQRRRQLKCDLSQALAGGELEVHYQPLVCVAERRLIGFEALLRWYHPVRGAVPPSEFVPLAEELGLIVPIGAWVLEQACNVAASWPSDVKVAVNLSAVQIGNPFLVATVADALASSGLQPHRLELEITERVMLNDAEETLTTLHALRDLGVTIAMDDFGTGYSSLSYLHRFPFDKVKIDRSFVQGLGTNADSRSIVRAVVALCRGLNMVTLAEGVETEIQLQELARLSCDEAQGYLFGAAVRPEATAAIVSEHRLAARMQEAAAA